MTADADDLEQELAESSEGLPKGGLRRRFDLQKALFILPNAFTAASIFCGLSAILYATTPGSDSRSFYLAAMAIFYAGFFDMFDGRVARMTKTQSDFGVQMDSLADVISFGVAPAVLMYRWALIELNLAGKIVAFIYAAAGAIRLARFNVLSARGLGSPTHFIGLPIPMAAAMLVSLVIAQAKTIGTQVEAVGSVVLLVLVLSYLMVSNVRYYTFKTYRPSIKNLPVLVLAGGASLFITITFRFSVTMVLIIGGYILMGLVAEVVYFRRRKESGWNQKHSPKTRLSEG